MPDIKSITITAENIAAKIKQNYPNLLWVGAKVGTAGGGTATTLYTIKKWLDDNKHAHTVEYHPEEKKKT